MKMPGIERARIDPRKLTDYLLSEDHPQGRAKAAFFGRLGYTRRDWPALEGDIRKLLWRGHARPGELSPFGRKYEILGNLTGPAGRTAQVLTVWIVLDGEDFPRFVTAIPQGLR